MSTWEFLSHQRSWGGDYNLPFSIQQLTVISVGLGLEPRALCTMQEFYYWAMAPAPNKQLMVICFSFFLLTCFLFDDRAQITLRSGMWKTFSNCWFKLNFCFSILEDIYIGLLSGRMFENVIWKLCMGWQDDSAGKDTCYASLVNRVRFPEPM